MVPVPIPDAQIWPGARRLVIAPPDGDMTNEQIRSCEALVDIDELSPRFCMRIELEAGDLERLQADPHFWLIIRGLALPPFALVVPDPVNPQEV